MRDQGERITSSKAGRRGVRVQRILAALLSVGIAAAGAALVVGDLACTDFTPQHCPPVDPPATAKYTSYQGISVDIGTSDLTGDVTYGMAKNVTGGSLTYQMSGKQLHLEITADANAKRITAEVPTTCTDASSGSFTLVIDLPAIHNPGDGLNVTVE